jgi:hypothetical protein
VTARVVETSSFDPNVFVEELKGAPADLDVGTRLSVELLD